jgi:hypothetical protein
MIDGGFDEYGELVRLVYTHMEFARIERSHVNRGWLRHPVEQRFYWCQV